MRILATLTATTFCFLILASASAQESLPWSKAAPLTTDAKELLEAANDIEEFDEEATIQYLYQHFEVKFHADGRIDHSEHMIYKVLSREGIEPASTIESSWTPWYEGKPQVQSRVISRRGSVSELDESTLTESTLGQLSEGILSDD
ncbi:MAG: DUF3857 domain-containing protein, partial [Mariniblastus sp.]